jgi:diacylglycerol kinase (ATP)
VAEVAAQAASEGAEKVVVVGGDGTINEAVNGFCRSGCEQLPQLGIVPTGSSNDLAKSLGMNGSLQRSCEAVVRGAVRYVDVGRAGPHYFCSASCLGYFAEVAAVSLEMTGLRGSSRYVRAALSVVRRMTSGWRMEVRADGQTFAGEYAVLLVCNAPRFGGLTMLPGAAPDDGALDCLLIEMASKAEALHLIGLVYAKAMERHRKARRFRARSLAVTLERASRLCNDGEVYGETFETIEYALLPKRLAILGAGVRRGRRGQGPMAVRSVGRRSGSAAREQAEAAR